jgi:hypothetical protein
MGMATPALADNAARGYYRTPFRLMSADEKLRRLDIMLMVTGLRCRGTPDNFQADFAAFEARHMSDLNWAARQLFADYTTRMSSGEASLALDRLSTEMANDYGQGHPWLGCHDLKGLTERLATQDGAQVLLEAAGETEDGDGGSPDMSNVPAPHEPTPPIYGTPAYAMPEEGRSVAAPVAAEAVGASYDSGNDDRASAPVTSFPMTSFAMNAPVVGPERSAVVASDEDRGDLVGDAPAGAAPAQDSTAQAQPSGTWRQDRF